jgi:hypothetical protein
MSEPQYPDGKLGEDDEGEVGVAIGIKDGNVIIMFPQPVAWLGLPPEQAMEFGRTVIKRARQIIDQSKH